MHLRFFFVCLVSALIYGAQVQADTTKWVMSVQKADLAPFKHRNGFGPGGINVDLISRVADELGVELSFKDYSIAQGRQKFQTGAINVDCCLNKVWFPGQDDLHVFSDPIYRLIEVFVFPKGEMFPVPSTKALKDKRVAGIAGFTYPDQQDYGSRVDGESPLEVLELLRDGKVDVAVLERHTASYLINQHIFDVEFGDPYYSVHVGVRLHRSQEKHLKEINEIIKEMKDSGFVKAVIKRNVR